MFNDYHKTIESSKKVILYTITLATDKFHYTSAETDITVGAITYLTDPGIKNSDVSNSGEEQRNKVKLTLTYQNEVAAYLLNFIPTMEILLEIKAFERDDPDEEVIFEWTGIYMSYETKYPYITLTFKPFDYELNRDLLTTAFGPDCQWTQYDINCAISAASFSSVGTVSVLNGLVATLDINLTALGPDRYTGGYIEVAGPYGAERAWIIKQENTSDIHLDRQLPSIVQGGAITVVPSCQGDYTRCKTTFNNRIHFMGAPYSNMINPHDGADGVTESL